MKSKLKDNNPNRKLYNALCRGGVALAAGLWVYCALNFNYSGYIMNCYNDSMPPNLGGLYSAFFRARQIEITFMVISIAFIFFKKYYWLRFRWYEYLIAFLISFISLVGPVYTVDVGETWIPLIWCKRMCVLSIFILCGLFLATLLLMAVIRIIFSKIEELSVIVPSGVFNLIVKYEKHTISYSWIIIFIIWLPVIMIGYPGGFGWDEYHQMLQYFGEYEKSQMWPFIGSIYYGTVIKLGIHMFTTNEAGLFLLSLTQMAFLSFVFAYTIDTLKRIGIRIRYRLLLLFSYIFLPLYWSFCTSIIKDALYAGFVVLLLNELIKYFFLEINKWWYMKLVLIGTLTCISHVSGTMIVLMLLFGLILKTLLTKKHIDTYRFRFFIALSVCYLSSSIYYNLLDCNGIPKREVRWYFTIPMQQTARYIKYHEDDVTMEEKKIINDFCEYDQLAETYKYYVSDYSVQWYRENNTPQIIVNYLIVWFKMFWKHPLTYVQATLSQIYGYFYVDDAFSQYIYNTPNDPKNFPDYVFNIPEKTAAIHEYFDVLTMGLFNAPVLGLLNNVGVYVWFSLWMFIRACVRKNLQFIYLMTPNLVGILACIVSPNFYWEACGVRYALPVMWTMPILLILLTKFQRKPFNIVSSIH